MSQGVVTDTYITAIANALRAKHNTDKTFKPSQMADAIRLIGFELPETHSFAGASDSDFGALIDAAHAGLVDLRTDCGWAVGDVRNITIGAFTAGGIANEQQSIDIVLTSFAQYEGCWNILQFDFKDCIANQYRTWGGNYYTDRVKYGESAMKTTILPALADAMPSYIKDRLIPFRVTTIGGGYYSELHYTAADNKLSLRAAKELFGNVDYTSNRENNVLVRVPYYETTANMKKTLGHGGSNTTWTTRTSAYGRDQSALGANSSGSWTLIATNGGATYGLAPFGCL